MSDWYSKEDKRSLMTLEDAHGGELAKIIQNSYAETNGIIQGMMTHAPMVAQQLMVLDTHYHNTLMLIEKALRLKRNISDEDIEQLEILAEFNQWIGSHSQRTNVKVTLKDHGRVYGIRFGGGQGHLPIQQHLAKEGMMKVVNWFAERTPSGKPRIIERLEKGKRDGYIVVSEVIDETAMDEVKISERDFALMLLKDWDTVPDDLPIWHELRICYTRKPLTDRDSWSWFSHRYPRLYSGVNRTVLKFEFQFGYPFWVGERTAAQYNVFNDCVSSAVCLNTSDTNYALVFYKTSYNSPMKSLILERATGELKEYREEYWIVEYLKNNLAIMEPFRSLHDGYDLSESHPYNALALQLEQIPETIKDRESIAECVLVTFDQDHLVSNGKLNRCRRVYAYTTESAEGRSEAKFHFEYELVENVDLVEIERQGSRY